MSTWCRIACFAAFLFGLTTLSSVVPLFTLKTENDKLRTEVRSLLSRNGTLEVTVDEQLFELGDLRQSQSFDMETVVPGKSTVIFTPGSDKIQVISDYDPDKWEQATGMKMPRPE